MSKPQHSFLHDLFLKHAHEVSDFISGRWPMEQDVADIVQESFLCLSSQYPNLETLPNPRALLFKTASNRVADRLRHRKTQEHHTEDIETASNMDCYEETQETLHLDSPATEFSSLPEDDLNRIFVDASLQLQQFLT